MLLINWNGKIIGNQEPVLQVGNRAFRYGEGLFETMKVFREKILLEDFHWDRLALGMKMLQMKAQDLPSVNLVKEQILSLCRQNECSGLARVRLQVCRGQEMELHYLIEAVPLDASANQLNEEGWTIDLYPYARRPCEAFSNLKTCNHLPYVMAEMFAREKGLDDCLVLNSENAIADSTIANIFLILGTKIYTPALDQGCVNGVMRRFLIEKMKGMGYSIRQDEIREEQLRSADEVFLTNAIRGIRWVKNFRDKAYHKDRTEDIYKKILSPIFT